MPAIAAPTLKGEILPAAIRLGFDFTAPVGTKLLGFNVYRRQGGAEPMLLPLNRAPIPQATWEDQQLQFGQTYRYLATAVVAIGTETVESLPSAELELVFLLQEIR
jgi:hypothetical protein